MEPPQLSIVDQAVAPIITIVLPLWAILFYRNWYRKRHED